MGNTNYKINDANIDKIVERTHSTDQRIANIYFTSEIIGRYIEKPWHWDHLSKYAIEYGITPAFMKQYPKPWNLKQLFDRYKTMDFDNKNKCARFILEYPKWFDHWREFTLDVCWKIILDHPDLPWDWKFICETYANIPLEVIQKCLDKLVWCDNLMRIIQKHKDNEQRKEDLLLFLQTEIAPSEQKIIPSAPLKSEIEGETNETQ